MTDPNFAFLVQPDRFMVGEGISETGALHLVLGLEFEGHLVGYQIHPEAAVDIVRGMSDWLDRHSDTSDLEP